MDIGWKIASAGAMALSALVAGKVAEVGWRVVTGTSVPHDDDDEVSLVAVVAFAAASAAVVALTQHYAMRGAKKWYGPAPAQGAGEITS